MIVAMPWVDGVWRNPKAQSGKGNGKESSKEAAALLAQAFSQLGNAFNSGKSGAKGGGKGAAKAKAAGSREAIQLKQGNGSATTSSARTPSKPSRTPRFTNDAWDAEC